MTTRQEQDTKYAEKYPEKRKVQRNGWTKRGTECSECGSKENLQFHHTNYIEDIGLTLCRDCHRKIHIALGDYGRPKTAQTESKLVVRKKGKWANGEAKYVIEDAGKYVKTLPQVNELLDMLCLDVMSQPTKEEPKQESPKEDEKFAQSLLREPQEQDTIEEFKKKQDEVFKDMLK